MKITNAEQYYKQVQERFPELSLKQIDQICKYGLRSFAGHNMIGGDVYLKSNYFSGYCGKLFLKQELFKKYLLIKNSIKARIRYRRAKKVYDGRYYFGMMKKEYKKYYLPYKKKNLGYMALNYKLPIYKSYEECLNFHWDYVFEYYKPIEGPFKIWLTNPKLKKFALIAKRDNNNKLQPVGKGKEKSIWKKRA